MKKRRSFDDKFKGKVALHAIREQQTLNQIASQYEVHPNQVSDWKKTLVQNAHQLFASSKAKGKKEDKEKAELIDSLYKEVGRLQMELQWLQKKTESFQLK